MKILLVISKEDEINKYTEKGVGKGRLINLSVLLWVADESHPSF